MPLKLYMHPFASFCQKVLVALYENGTPFEPLLVDLGNEQSRAAFLEVWPIGQFPVLRDAAKDRTIPESTIINVAAYFRRLMERPSFARVVQEAEPYFKYFPK